MAEVSVEDTQAPFGASVTWLDAEGNPASLDAIPTWSSDNETVASVVASDDGTSATVTLTGQLGAAIISSDATNNDGTSAHAQGTITVLASEATTGEISFDVPTPTPTA